MEKPHIYGDEAHFRALLARRIKSGEDLLAQAEGTRRRIEQAGKDRMQAFGIEAAWEAKFRKWFMGTGTALAEFLQEQLTGTPAYLRPNADPDGEELLPVFNAMLPADDGKHSIGIDNGEEWLSLALDELRELQGVVGKPKRRTPAPRAPEPEPTPTRWWNSLSSKWWVNALYIVGAVASIVGVALFLILR